MILNVTQVVKRAGLPGRLSKAMQQGIYAEESWWSRVSFSGNTAAQVCTEISKNTQRESFLSLGPSQIQSHT